jgi:uncharacterized protein
VVLAACSSGASTREPAPSIEPSADAPPAAVGSDATTPVVETGAPQGFTTVTVRITQADGAQCEICAWLADSPGQRARGLMRATSLGPAQGMVFVFEEERRGTFYMFDTPTPLSIAWFGAAGGFVGAAEMEPCLDTPAGACPRYAPDAPYQYALEVFQGGLDDLGVGPGAVLEVLGEIEPDRCPPA